MNVRIVTRAAGKIVSVLTMFVLQELRRLVLCFLIFYWFTFVGYTVVYYLKGGTSWVIAWYVHLSGDVFRPWNGKSFLMEEIFILALTLVLAYFQWWRPKHEDGTQEKHA